MKKCLIVIFQIFILLNFLENPINAMTCSSYNRSDTGASVASCPAEYYHINCVCYKGSCPENTQIDLTSTNRGCKCLYHFWYENDDSTNKPVNCLGKDVPCPTLSSTNYPYFFDTNSQCYKPTPTSSNCPYIREIQTKDDTKNYQCVFSCNSDEQAYPAVSTTPGKCLKSCKATASSSYPYYREDTQKCVELNECVTNKLYVDQEKYSCHTKCDHTLLSIEDLTTPASPKFYCTSKTDCAGTSNFHYLVSNINTCVNSCTNTNHENSKIKLTTHSYIDTATNVRRCVPDCSLTNKPYLLPSSNECVAKCLNTYKKIEDGKCVNGCTSGTYDYTIDDTQECVKGCPTDYFVYSTTGSAPFTCYKTCPDDYYHDLVNKACVKFTLSSTGFIVWNDPNKIIYTKCPATHPYYDDGGDFRHRCFNSEKGCNGDENPNTIFKFSQETALFTCLSNCPCTGAGCSPADVYRTEDNVCLSNTLCPASYPYQANVTCYKNGCPDENMQFFIDAHKNRLCYDQMPTNCPESSLVYIQDLKCVTGCDTEHPFYIKLPSDTSTPSSSKPGYCYATPDGCFSHLHSSTKNFYIGDTDKQCLTSCASGKYKIQIQPGTDHPYPRERGTCLSDCPEDFPYKEGTSGGTCYKDDCPSNLYIKYGILSFPFPCLKCDGSDSESTYKYKYKRYCVDDCKKTPFKFTSTTGECVETCSDSEKYYLLSDKFCKTSCGNGKVYNPNTFECLATGVTNCLDVKGYPYYPYFEASPTTHKPCGTSCGDTEYYDPKTKICSNTCTKYLSTDDPKRCADTCEVYEKVEVVGTINKCKKTCPAFFYVDSTVTAPTPSTTCFDTYDQCVSKFTISKVKYYSNTTKECLLDCPKHEYYSKGNACYEKCPPDSPYYAITSSTTPAVCYNTCKDSSPTPKYLFTVEGGYECFADCPVDHNFVVSGTYDCVKECPKEKPFYSKVSGTNHYECLDECNSVSGQFAKDYECVTECNSDNSGYKPYLSVEESKCVSQCPDKYPYAEKVTGKNYYKCLDKCSNVLSPTNECVSICPADAVYIGKDNHCKKECDPITDGIYYTAKGTTHQTYQCSFSCPTGTEFTVYKNYECLQDCPKSGSTYTHFKEINKRICYSDFCVHDPIYSFSNTLSSGTIKDCSNKCDTSIPYYLNTKECATNCNSITNKTIDENNACVVHCHYDEGSDYKFSSDENPTFPHPKCFKNCSDSVANPTKIKYSTKDYICVAKCPTSEPFKRPGGECRTSCDLDSKYKYAYKTGAAADDDYECRDSCPDGTYYYEDDYICRTTCSRNSIDGFNVKSTKRCVSSCSLEPKYNKTYLKTDASTTTGDITMNTCVDICNGDSYKSKFTTYDLKCKDACTAPDIYYEDSDKVCLPYCPNGTHVNVNSDINKCVHDCKSTEFLTDLGQCKGACDTTNGFIYYFLNEKICRKNCGNYLTDDKICTPTCPAETGTGPSTNIYANDTHCLNTCPTTQKYFVYQYEKNEVDVQHKCLTDCPSDYPFWYKITDANSKDAYGCFSSCAKIKILGKSAVDVKYYVSDPDPKINAKECQTTCANFIGVDGECIKECPKDAPYYNPGDKQCYVKCPTVNPALPVHKKGEYECIAISSCTTAIDYDTNECVERCQVNQHWGQESASSPIYCLNNCNSKFGYLVTPDLRCVDSCEHIDLNTNIDETQTKCLCRNLYYYDADTGLQKCLPYNYDICVDAFIAANIVDAKRYRYNVKGTKECVKICKTVATEDLVCIPPNSTCPENSEYFVYPNGQATCKCKYKFYTLSNTQRICLGEFTDCPSTKSFIDLDTKECIASCPPTKYNLMNTFCVTDCPTYFTKSESPSKTCKCGDGTKYWYKEPKEGGGYDFFCLDQSPKCVDKHPYGKYTTKECVDKCVNSATEDNNQDYIVYGDNCYPSCGSITNTQLSAVDEKDPLYKIAHYTCLCKNLWYKNPSEIAGSTCTTMDVSNNHCYSITGFNFNYQISDTRECVVDCPATHPYSFNDKCYKDCDKVGFEAVADEVSHKCVCKNAWTETSHTNPLRREKKCYPSCDNVDPSDFVSPPADSQVFQIMSTKQCIKEVDCPEGLYKFNFGCYQDKCPLYSKYDSSTRNNCTCINLWYWVDDTKTKKHCMADTDNACPVSIDDKQYKVVAEKRCTSSEECKSTEGMVIFNYDCLSECPLWSKVKTGANTYNCTCDEGYGYWYHESSTTIACGYTSCPEGKPNVIEGTKECVHNCGQTESYKFHLLDQCLNNFNKCAGKSFKTEIIDGGGTSNGYTECVYRTLDDAVNKTNLTKIVAEDLKLYYYNSTKKDYVYYSKFDTNVQIYAINKNSMEDAELLRRADLSYLDLTNCVNKLYSSNGLSERDNVIVVKYDILSSDKYMVNRVEYEFYSSKTFEKIEPSICDAKSIVVSYPVAYSVNKYDGTSNQVYNPYKKIFTLAKELYKINTEYDVYNQTSPIYKDPCISCEIDGKDLVLEDRANYLYPASSTCEDNCTFYWTDYSKERINCLCSPKEHFDIERKLPTMNYNFSLDEIKDNQGGSSNLPVFLCLSRLDEKNKIAKNGGFFYMAIAIVMEVCLVIISGVVGYSRAIGKIGEDLQVGPNAMGTSGNPPPRDSIPNSGNKNYAGNNQDLGYLDSRSNMKNDYNNQQGQQNNYRQGSQANMVNNNNIINNQGNDELIKIKRIGLSNDRGNRQKLPMYNEKEQDDDKESEASSELKDISSSESLFKELKNEQKMLRFPFQKAIRLDKNGTLIMILSSIFDKIYFTKTLLFLRKFDIFSAYLSLYILFHVLLLTVIAFFFDIKTIKKIWNEKNFPGTDWYLLYGLISNIVVFVAYKLLNCLLSNNDKIEALLGLKYNVERREYLKNKKGISTEELLYQRYHKVLSEIKIKMIIYYAICFMLIIFSFIYLTVFCGIYTGTKKRVFKAYGIAILEILIIKIVYGIFLGALRKVSIDSKIKCLYKFVRGCTIYLS